MLMNAQVDKMIATKMPHAKTRTDPTRARVTMVTWTTGETVMVGIPHLILLVRKHIYT